MALTEENTLDSLSVITSFYSEYTYVDYIQYTYRAQYSNIVGVLMAATANSWDVQTANHSLIAKAYAQKLSHGIDNNKNQLMPTPSYSYIAGPPPVWYVKVLNRAISCYTMWSTLFWNNIWNLVTPGHDFKRYFSNVLCNGIMIEMLGIFCHILRLQKEFDLIMYNMHWGAISLVCLTVRVNNGADYMPF